MGLWRRRGRALTSDGGATWRVRQTPLMANATALDFWGVRLGWVVDDLGEVIHSRDGGRTWALQDSGLASAGVAIQFTDHAVGLVASGDQLAATTVGGWPDTRGPVTTAYRHRPVVRGSRVTLWFQVADEQCDWLPPT